MPSLVAIARTGPDLVHSLLDVWDRGDAALPLDPSAPAPLRAALLEAMAPAMLIDDDGAHPLDGGRNVAPGDALVIATSGSTGSPKGVVHTHSSLTASATMISRALEVDPATDRWLCCLPLNHIAGLAIIVRAIVTGTTLEVHHRFDANAVVDAAARGATLTSLVPTTLGRIDPSIFRRIIVGGSAMPDHLPSNCRASYGMTETGSAVVFDGAVLDGAEVRIVDGEILVRGPMLLRCYRDGGDPRDADGWFATGDSGVFDDAGRLVVHGRRGDMIITGGENVWPLPVEAIIERLDSVNEVAVVGRPDPEWGHVVTAIVVASDRSRPPTLDELRDAVRAELPSFCAPHAIEIRDELPRTALGKVRRGDLSRPLD